MRALAPGTYEIVDSEIIELEIRKGEERLFYGKGLISPEQEKNLLPYLQGKTSLLIRTNDPDHKQSIELALGAGYKSQAGSASAHQTCPA
jgi:hypothetical protein